MKIWKRNAVIAGALVLICAGIYLNWLYNGESVDLTQVLDADKILGESTLVMQSETDLSVKEASTELGVEAEFAQMRLSRQIARDEAVALLQETIAYAGSMDEARPESLKLEGIIAEALTESKIESLVIAKGYQDCVAYISEEGISLAVATPENGLMEEDVSLLADIVMAQTDFGLPEIRIFGVE